MNNKKRFTTPMTPVSWGELLDKITILEIKQQKIASQSALKNIQHELKALSETAVPVMQEIAFRDQISQLIVDLRDINLKLWGVEDDLRIAEQRQIFDDRFIQLARSVYQLNDQRAKLKKDINLLLASEFVEEKSYQGFQL